jgi:hypothetical protein
MNEWQHRERRFDEPNDRKLSESGHARSRRGFFAICGALTMHSLRGFAAKGGKVWSPKIHVSPRFQPFNHHIPNTNTPLGAERGVRMPGLVAPAVGFVRLRRDQPPKLLFHLFFHPHHVVLDAHGVMVHVGGVQHDGGFAGVFPPMGDAA